MRQFDTVVNPQKELQDSMASAIQRHQNTKQPVMPCKVVSRSGWMVSVSLMVDTAKNIPTLENIPVMLPAYFYAPLQAGDFGLLIPADFYIDRVVESGTKSDPSETPGNLSGYAFMPLPQKAWNPAAGAELTAVYSPSGANHVAVGDEMVEITTPAHQVSMDDLFTYLLAMQSAYNAQLIALGQSGYAGTFE